jgi:hypothetical protein
MGAQGYFPAASSVLGGVWVSMFMSSDGGQDAGVSTRLPNSSVLAAWEREGCVAVPCHGHLQEVGQECQLERSEG